MFVSLLEKILGTVIFWKENFLKVLNTTFIEGKDNAVKLDK